MKAAGLFVVRIADGLSAMSVKPNAPHEGGISKMNRQDISDLLRILGFSLVNAAARLLEEQSGADSHPEPNPPKTAPEARKRGRPKKQPIPEPNIAQLRAESEAEQMMETIVDFKTCELCGRKLPPDALPIHLINCKAASAGYWDNKP